jgi:hypothetical protein
MPHRSRPLSLYSFNFHLDSMSLVVISDVALEVIMFERTLFILGICLSGLVKCIPTRSVAFTASWGALLIRYSRCDSSNCLGKNLTRFRSLFSPTVLIFCASHPLCLINPSWLVITLLVCATTRSHKQQHAKATEFVRLFFIHEFLSDAVLLPQI